MFGLFSKTARWNNEDAQIELVSYIIEAATADDIGKKVQAQDKVFYLQNRTGWSNKETADRCVHAVSMIKASFDKETYDECKAIARNLYITLT